MVLGAVPLIISALKGYQSLNKRRYDFKRRKLHVDCMIRALDCQQSLILSDVKIVLRNARLDEIMIDEGIGNCHYQDLFKRPDIHSAVASVLRENFSAYVDIFNNVRLPFSASQEL